MKLTPLDIRHKEFKRGMRGYVDGEVDEFLDEIADEFERLFKENIELAERGESLQEKIDQYRNLEETLQNTLVAAQRSAEELKANAQKEAQLMLSEAELKARQMVNESYADKQAVEKQIVVLKSSEEDFRFKFRSLLEGYVKQLSEIDAESKKAGRFATPTRPDQRGHGARRRQPAGHRAAGSQAGRAHAAARGASGGARSRCVAGCHGRPAYAAPAAASSSQPAQPCAGRQRRSAPRRAAGSEPRQGEQRPAGAVPGRARRPAGRRRERGRRQRLQVVTRGPCGARPTTCAWPSGSCPAGAARRSPASSRAACACA